MPDITHIEAEIAQTEAQVANLRPGCEKRVVWAGEPATRTPFALLYVHGFSASAGELRPLPDLVAQGLGANTYFARLTGHGQDGPAMAEATLADWRADVAAAIEVAQTIGERVILMGCSTGCTLTTLALAEGAAAHAVIHVSPNFGLANRAVQLLIDLPGARHWVGYVAGHSRSFVPINDAHAAFWTTQYPTKALFPMAEAVRAVRRADLGRVTTPAFFAYNKADQVVRAAATESVMSRWGGTKHADVLVQGPDDDAMGHVMAGDVFSPGQTAPLARRILAWLGAL